MHENYYPVDPALTANGALVALARMYGEAASMPTPLMAGDDIAAGSVRFAGSTMSAEFAARLGVAGIFNGSASVGEIAMTFDAMLYIDKDAQVTPTSVIAGTRWAIGYRMAIRTLKVEASASVDFAAVAASASVGRLSANYEIVGYGLGAAGFQMISNTLPPLGQFNYDAYYKFSNVLAKQLGDYVATQAATLRPAAVGVRFATVVDEDPLIRARTIYFAVRWIAERKKLREALANPRALDQDVLREVYRRIANVVDPEASISDGAEKAAEEWLVKQF